MEWIVRNAIAAALLPPGSLLLVVLCGLALMRRRRFFGRSLIALGLVSLYLLSTQYVADGLLQTLEPPPIDLANTSGQAIVVLGAGTYFDAPEYGSTTVNANALARLRYAAHLYRATRKPVLVSGGTPEGAPTGEATHMQTVLERDFQVPVQWREDQSRTTLDNARLSHAILSAAGIRRIYLVTQAWHMPRAELAFERAGFEVIPAPTGYATRFRVTMLDFVPDARALRDSSVYFHEVLGIGWYRLIFAFPRWL
ncbi:MAG TPA: YdcF family protein [Burkholderiales bacterium]|nr:YdcF family protein [Burkholderiales bacterium]